MLGSKVEKGYARDIGTPAGKTNDIILVPVLKSADDVVLGGIKKIRRRRDRELHLRAGETTEKIEIDLYVCTVCGCKVTVYKYVRNNGCGIFAFGIDHYVVHNFCPWLTFFHIPGPDNDRSFFRIDRSDYSTEKQKFEL